MCGCGDASGSAGQAYLAWPSLLQPSWGRLPVLAEITRSTTRITADGGHDVRKRSMSLASLASAAAGAGGPNQADSRRPFLIDQVPVATPA
jgi:hypothetical protein